LVKYCGIEQVKRYARMISFEDLGFATMDEYEDHIEELVESASRTIDRYCRRPNDFFNGGSSLVEYHDGKPVDMPNYYELGWRSAKILEFRRTFWLDHAPVLDLTRVEENKASIGEAENWLTILPSDYKVDKKTGRVIFAIRSIPAQGYQNVRFTYTAGYATLPSEISSVCAQLVANELKAEAQHYTTQLTRWRRPEPLDFMIPEIFTPYLKQKLSAYVKRRI